MNIAKQIAYFAFASFASCGPSEAELQKTEAENAKRKHDSVETHILRINRLIIKEASDLKATLDVIDTTHLSMKTGSKDVPNGEIWMFHECWENPQLANQPADVETFDCPRVLNNDNREFFPNLVLNGNCTFLLLTPQVHNHSTFTTGRYSVGNDIELRYIAGGATIAVPSYYTFYDYTIICYKPDDKLLESLKSHISEALSWKRDPYLIKNFSNYFFDYDDVQNSLMAILNTSSFHKYEHTP